jgi:uncharacterized protein
MKAIVYHSADLDGMMSAAIAKKFLTENGEECELLPFNYGQKEPDLSEYETVFVLDVCLPYQTMVFLNQQNKLIWIDHHKSSIELMNSFDIVGNQSVEYSACELTWMYFHPRLPIPTVVEWLGLYDTFRHVGHSDEKDILYFQYGARVFFNTIQRCIQYLGDADLLYELTRDGYTILLYLQHQAVRQLDKAFLMNIENYNFIGMNAPGLNPSILTKSDNFNDSFAGYAIVTFTGTRWGVSLYSDTVDVSVIATKFGGGGHPGASGFSVPDIKPFII